ncbi:hypothetical protein SGADD03_02237 [Streptococcus gallolyticus]|uniref:Uncharacterized protein n=1 Tax=Streptococcus gallolyticus TaxID=315405 RepID=A0A139QGE7_9STRE|nr:hypothetical protein SGADD03_02237 [Streptococcus gallolyticus]
MLSSHAPFFGYFLSTVYILYLETFLSKDKFKKILKIYYLKNFGIKIL